MINYKPYEPKGIIPLCIKQFELRRWFKTNGRTIISILGTLAMLVVMAFILSLEGA